MAVEDEQASTEPIVPFVEVPDPIPGQFQGLPIGALAPDFALPDLDGNQRSLDEFRGQRLLLLFIDPRCKFCGPTVHAVARRLDELGSRAPLVLVISVGDAASNRAWFTQYRLQATVLLQRQAEIALRYSALGFPMAYLIDEEGRIGSELAVGGPAVLALMQPTAPSQPGSGLGHIARPLSESRLKRDGLSAGTEAPDFRLPRVDGGELSLSQFRGKTVLLVFSAPDCGPCNQLAPLLEEAARRRPEVQVLMISRGDVEENRGKILEHGLTFPVVLQKQWETSREYAIFATPVGYLIDEQGVIREPVAIGADQILALLAGSASR